MSEDHVCRILRARPKFQARRVLGVRWDLSSGHGMPIAAGPLLAGYALRPTASLIPLRCRRISRLRSIRNAFRNMFAIRAVDLRALHLFWRIWRIWAIFPAGQI